jgi:hypothetical protein
MTVMHPPLMRLSQLVQQSTWLTSLLSCLHTYFPRRQILEDLVLQHGYVLASVSGVTLLGLQAPNVSSHILIIGNMLTLCTSDPRISHLIPIIGSPNYAALLRARAQEEGLAFTAPHWPRALDALVRTCDPVNLPLDFWAGKRILAICGGRDTLVPAKEGGTLDFVNALQGRGMGDRAKVLIDEAAGHEVTPQMLEWVVGWVWDSAMNEK